MARKQANTIELDLKPGAVVVALLPGARETKRRPAIVVSTSDYHAARPDVLLAIVTSRVEDADTAFDCVLFDWRGAGLRTPCAMRSYLFTIEQSQARVIGHLSDLDWREVQNRLARALAT